MERSALAGKNIIKVKGQGHFTVFVLMSLPVLSTFNVIYRYLSIDVLELYKTFFLVLSLNPHLDKVVKLLPLLYKMRVIATPLKPLEI